MRQECDVPLIRNGRGDGPGGSSPSNNSTQAASENLPARLRYTLEPKADNSQTGEKQPCRLQCDGSVASGAMQGQATKRQGRSAPGYGWRWSWCLYHVSQLGLASRGRKKAIKSGSPHGAQAR